jgi:hypothetical protein
MVAKEKRYTGNRKHIRQPIFENAYLYNEGRDYLGSICNYSRNGIFVRSKIAFNVGEEISLLCPRPENKDKVTRVTARVVRKERLGFALRFIDSKK